MNELLKWTKRLGAALCGLLIVTIGLAPLDGDNGIGLAAIAMADDDDGGDDDGDDDDDGGWKPRRSIIDNLRPPRPQARQRRRAPQPAIPDFARSELVGRGLDNTDIARLTAAGYVVLDQASLVSSGQTVHRLRVPPSLTLDRARADILASSPQASVDFNHYYQPNTGNECVTTQCLARHVIGWSPTGENAKVCSSGIRIGMIDTAINADHDALSGGRIEVKRMTTDKLPLSGKQHGTAVAALLVGNPAGRSPGLLPGAELIAVDTFHRLRGRHDIADAYSLVKALDYLEGRNVEIINLSLTGPANAVLETAIKRMAENGIVLVAAAGNDGPKAKPAYPAAYPEVVAVTAVDRQKRAYRRAIRGPHIDLAAPGVDVWIVASVAGSRPRTGTSFAAPFVTAAIALAQKLAPDAQRETVLSRVTSAAEDLGAPGRDDIFGWGLLNPAGLCG